MKLNYYTLFYCFLVIIFCQCSNSQNCDSPFIAPTNKVIEINTKMTDDFKERSLYNKKILYKKLCNVLSNTEKIVLIEKSLRGNNQYFGILYVYDDNKLYSYKTDGNTLKVSEGNKFDEYGGLEKFLTSIKDSVVLKMEAKVKNYTKVIDGTPTSIYFIDNKDQISKLYIL